MLYFYRLELYNLNPNSMLHVTTFITLYECFLGIEPHFAVWKHFFSVKPQPSRGSPVVVGGTGFLLRVCTAREYLELSFLTFNKGWHLDFFYCTNPEPSLPKFKG